MHTGFFVDLLSSISCCAFCSLKDRAMLIFTYSFRCIETFQIISETCVASLTFITNYTRSTLKATIIIYCMCFIFHLHPQQRCNSKKIISKMLSHIQQSGCVGRFLIGL